MPKFLKIVFRTKVDIDCSCQRKMTVSATKRVVLLVDNSVCHQEC